MTDQQQWRIFYAMLVSWAYHPKHPHPGNVDPEELAYEADKLLRLMKNAEEQRWPAGQQ